MIARLVVGELAELHRPEGQFADEEARMTERPEFHGRSSVRQYPRLRDDRQVAMIDWEVRWI
jgi:hypothetical protein